MSNPLNQHANIELGLISINLVTAMCLIAQIQLATRHGSNDGPSRQVAESFARLLQDMINAQTTEFKDILEKGWDPAFDIER